MKKISIIFLIIFVTNCMVINTPNDIGEAEALEVLVKEIEDYYTVRDNKIRGLISFEDNFRNLRNRNLYYCEEICFISFVNTEVVERLYYLPDHVKIGFYGVHTRLTTSSFDSKIVPLSENTNYPMIRDSYSNFALKGKVGDYYFFIGSRVLFENYSMIEIFSIPFEELGNGEYYSFQLFFKGRDLLNIEVASIVDFEFAIPCDFRI